MNKPMSKTFTIWSSDEEQELISQIPVYSVQDIARMHNRSVKAIEMRIEHMIRRMHHNGATYKELSKQFHKSVADIERIATTTTQTMEKKMDLNKRLNAIEDMLSKIYKKQKKLEELIRIRHAS